MLAGDYALVGLGLGAIAALSGVGLLITYRSTGVFNVGHGAVAMVAAYLFWQLTDVWSLPVWVAAPVVLFVFAPAFGMLLERLLIHRLTALDPLYNFLLTFGLTLVLQDVVRREYGITSQPYPQPAGLDKPLNLGLFEYPGYQVFVLVLAAAVCAGVWLLIDAGVSVVELGRAAAALGRR